MDGKGMDIKSNQDLCNCLRAVCPVCFLPCPACESSKCGPNCRKNRTCENEADVTDKDENQYSSESSQSEDKTFDENAVYIKPEPNICNCLEPSCPECFSSPSCESSKYGHSSQRNPTWEYEGHVEDGANSNITEKKSSSELSEYEEKKKLDGKGMEFKSDQDLCNCPEPSCSECFSSPSYESSKYGHSNRRNPTWEYEADDADEDENQYSSESYESEEEKVFDENGIHIESGLDLCDCLEASCPGCFLPCPACKSPKCGNECRRNRTWEYKADNADEDENQYSSELSESEEERIYDENGIHIETGLDLCDCLDANCPGCFFLPCPSCQSSKCGHECRRNRTWEYVVHVRDEDGNQYSSESSESE